MILPVKDGGPGLAQCLRALAEQDVPGYDIEVVVVDSGSRDDSVAVARRTGAHVHEIAPEDFDHGATRNLGVRLSRGSILVFTTQDAYATTPDFLARLIAPLQQPGVAGAYARQVCHEGAHPPEQYFLDFLYGPSSRRQRAADTSELSMHTTMFSNVASAIPRERLEQTGFVEDIIMSEDQEWAVRMLLAGWELCYVADAVVRHSHPYTRREAFRRFFDSGVSAERTYLAGARPSMAVLRRQTVRYAVGEVRWMVRSRCARWLPYAAVYESTKFVGLHLGAQHRRLPLWLARRCSATPSYWQPGHRGACAETAPVSAAEPAATAPVTGQRGRHAAP